MITIKSRGEIDLMRANAQMLCGVLAEVVAQAQPGTSTAELDALAEDLIRRQGGEPSFKGYRGFPGSICVSLNDEIVHGIPSPNRVLAEGDLLSIDIGLIKDGFCADTATSVAVGRLDAHVAHLIEVDREALRRGIEQARPGNRVGDISNAIGSYIESQGLGIVKNFVGHGIGRKMHEDPNVPNFGPAGKGPRLRSGMVLAIEPMVMEDLGVERVADDGWTVHTPQGGLAVHLEEMVLITEGGYEILTDRHSLEGSLVTPLQPARSGSAGLRS